MARWEPSYSNVAGSEYSTVGSYMLRCQGSKARMTFVCQVEEERARPIQDPSAPRLFFVCVCVCACVCACALALVGVGVGKVEEWKPFHPSLAFSLYYRPPPPAPAPTPAPKPPTRDVGVQTGRTQNLLALWLLFLILTSRKTNLFDSNLRWC